MDNYTTAGHVIRNYRQKAKNAGYNVDGYTDEEILRFLGDDLRNQGQTHEQIAETYGDDFSSQYRDNLNAPEKGREGFFGGIKEVGAGFGKGIDGLMSSATALGGMAADFYGLEGVSDSLMDTSAKFRAEAARGGPSIERATDVRWDDIGEVSRFLAGGFGEAAPSVLEAGASFALGGGGGYLIAKQMAKKRLREVVKNVNKDNLDEVFKSAINVDRAAQAGKRIGSNIALSGSSFGMNTGEIYSELYSYSALDEKDPDYISEEKARDLSVSHGLLAGGLDYASAGAMLNRILGIGDKQATSYLKRVVQGLPAGVFVEGATEAAQQFISMSAEKYAHGNEEPFTEDEINQMVDAGILGMLGGTQFTAIGSIKGPKKESTDISGVDDETIAGDPEKNTATIDERLATLNERLQVEDDTFQVGMEVEQFLGVSGKVTAVRSDGMIEVMPSEGGEPLTLRADTLSEKLAPIEELEARLDEVKVTADQGDPSSLKEEEILNEKIEEQKQKKEPKPQPAKAPKAEEKSKAVLDTPDSYQVIENISESLAKDIEEVYNAIKDVAENGKGGFRRSNSSKEAILVAAGVPASTIKKWKNPVVRGKLIAAGIMKDARGTWLPETKIDKEKAEEVRLKKISRREVELVDRLKVGVGDNVVSNNEERTILRITDDNLVLFEEDGTPVEPSTLKLPRPKKKAQPPKISNAPTEEDYQQARDEVVTERQTEEVPEGVNDGLAFEAETEKLIDERAAQIAIDRAKDRKLKQAEEADESKSNEEIVKEIEDKTEEEVKPKVLPEGQIPNKFIGEFDVTEGVSSSLNEDGTFNKAEWEGLSDRESTSTKQTKGGKKKKRHKHLVIVSLWCLRK